VNPKPGRPGKTICEVLSLLTRTQHIHHPIQDILHFVLTNNNILLPNTSYTMKTQIILLLSFWTPSYFSQSGEKNIVQSATTAYGLDVSFPIQNSVSTNYPELPHNLDSSLPVPKKYQGMPIQSLGDRQKVYRDHIHGCLTKESLSLRPVRTFPYGHESTSTTIDRKYDRGRL